MADEKPIIKATTPNSNKYDTKIDVYTNWYKLYARKF